MNLSALTQRWAQSSPRDRRAAMVIAVALGVLVIAYVVMPLIDDWSAARAQIDGAHEQLAAVTDKLNRWKTVRDRLRPLYGPAIDAPLPTADDVRIHFVKALQDALQAGGVQVESIRPQGFQSLKEVDGVSLALYQVAGKCSAEQLPQCLAQLARAPRVIMVDRLATSTGNRNGGGGGPLSLSMTVATFARDGGSAGVGSIGGTPEVPGVPGGGSGGLP